MNFRSRLTLLMIVFLTVVIVITGLFVYYKSSQIIVGLTKNSALELINSQNHVISGLIEKEILLLGTLTSEKSVVDLLADQNNPSKATIVNDLLIRYAQDKPNLHGILLNNLSGKTLATNNTSEVGLDLSHRNYHKETIASKASVISETLISKFNGNQIFVATRPVFDPLTKQLIGYMASAISSESMAIHLKDMKLNGASSSYAYLVDEKGNLIYHPDSKKIGQPVESLEVLDALSNMQNGTIPSSTIVQYTLDNQQMISACSLIPQTKWMLVIVGNMSEFEAPIKKMNSITIVFSVLITIIASIIAFFMARQIATPIIKNLEDKNEELTALYEEISASEEELHQQLDELNEHRAKILEMAYHDSLTHLANRTLLIEKLNTYIFDSMNTPAKVAVAFLDLDNFKRVNDTLGHFIGDELLVAVSKRLMDSVCTGGLIARLSGDEFSIVITNFENVEEILPTFDKIMEQFLDPFNIKGKTITLTASIGISIYPDDGSTVEELLRNADTAMYKSKELGKNTYQFFTDSMKSELLQKTELERMLRNAVGLDEFILYYQPQYHIKSNKLRGFEALIRWNSHELGFLSPLKFIPAAEETGLIVPIGTWVLKTACMTCKKIISENSDSLIMSVNISAIQIKHKDFYDTVMDCIRISGIAPRNLELEVTESIFIGNDNQSIGVLKRLKEAGIGIALDDFGTGYSSLSYLKELPISLLKIDKSFISQTDSLNEKKNLTESIISLVHRLNIETVAEGIETKEQLDCLTKFNCDILQGYYFSKPIPEVQINEIIQKLSKELHNP